MNDSHLVSYFLATNVAFCLLEPVTVRRFGLRAAVVCGAFAMAAGCGLRCLATEVACSEWWRAAHPGSSRRLQRNLTIAGTMFVGAAQPFFQCTPSLLAANWFGENETTFAATVALNANQLGIAGSYAVGAMLVHSEVALRRYFAVLALASLLLAVGCLVQFRERPHKPPSYSALESLRREAAQLERKRCFESLRQESFRLHNSLADKAPRLDEEAKTEEGFFEDSSTPRAVTEVDGAEEDALVEKGTFFLGGCESGDADDADERGSEPRKSRRPLPALLLRRWLVNYRRVGHGALDVTRNMLSEIKQLAHFEGFNACLVAFVSSIVASNIFSTFLPHLVTTARKTTEHAATINMRIAVLGSGFQVAIMAGSLCFGAAVDATKAYKLATFAAFLGTLVSLVAVAEESTKGHLLELAVLALGFFVGPIQPIAAELAVDVTYPDGNENTIVAIQQTAGNLISAGAVPIFNAASDFAARVDAAAKYGVRLDYALLASVTLLAAVYFRLFGWYAPLRRLAHNTSAANLAEENAASDIMARFSRSKYQTL